MEGSPDIPAPTARSCSRCHHDLSRLPRTAHFCPHCGQNQVEIPLASVSESIFPPPPPAPEYFHSLVIVGYGRAMNSLGNRYETGRGVARNADEALRCFCKAARLGNSEARSRLLTRGVGSGAGNQPISPDAPSDQPSPPVATESQTP